MKILNLGCGHSDYGTDRVDCVKTPTTTLIHDLNKPFPFEDNIFDEILAQNVLEHIKNIGTFADECYRVLKPNGKIIISTDNAGYIAFHILKSHEHNKFIQNQYKSHNYKHDNKIDAHYHMFVPSNLQHLFRKFKEHKFEYAYGGRNRLVNFLIKLIPFHLGAISIRVVAKK